MLPVNSFVRPVDALKVSDTRIVLAVDPSAPGADDIDLPERCCLVKLANSVTYDRLVPHILAAVAGSSSEVWIRR
jgi:hypothetical protein